MACVNVVNKYFVYSLTVSEILMFCGAQCTITVGMLDGVW